MAVLVALALILSVATTAIAAPKNSPGTNLTVSPGRAEIGDKVTISGSGFGQRTGVTLWFRGEKIAKTTTGRKGRFSKSWTVPQDAISSYITATSPGKRASDRLKLPIPETTSPETTTPETTTPETTSPETTMPETTTPETTSPETTTPEVESGELWSEAGTWGGRVPGAGDRVEIPSGKTVILDTDTAPLASLTINGTLRFADDDETLTAGHIMVHGTMEVGTESDPYTSRARIILTGADRTEDIMGMGSKFIGVMDGTLDVHGEERVGWTRLSATAQRGQNRLVLDENPGWRIGDRIAIASTDFGAEQSEEAIIIAVAGDTVTLDKSLSYSHFGVKQTIAGKVVDERAEVALLSRNITIEGEEKSSADGFGGQIMAMGSGKIRMEGAELNRMGQKNILRRYPIHFHMLGDGGQNSYLRNTAIHHANNRCVTIHGTNRLRVEGNTCYETLGHGFFMEDGAETKNTLDGNLSFGIRKPKDGERLLVSDARPAAFWITNPDNTVTNNVAAGSEGFGFWFAFPEHPTGLSKNASVWPRYTPLGNVSGNVVHSSGHSGFFVDDGPASNGSNTEVTYYDPRTTSAPPRSNADTDTLGADFRGITAYKNRHWGVWLRGADHTVSDSVLADNAIGATFASDESYLVGSLVVGETENLGNANDYEKRTGRIGTNGRALPQPWRPDFPIRGFEFYDGKVGTSGTTFANYQPTVARQASAFGMRLDNSFQVHPDNYLEGATFINSKRLYLQEPGETRDGDRSVVFVDRDGSLTGTTGAVLTSNTPFLTRSGCTRNSEWNAYVCPPALDHVALGVGTMDGSPASIKPLKLTSEQGRVQTLNGCCDNETHAFTSVVAGEMYEVAFNGGTPEDRRLQFILRHGDDRDVTLKIPYARDPKVMRWGDCDLRDGKSWCQGVQARSVAELRASTVKKSSYYYDAAGDMLYLRIVARMPMPADDVGANVDWVDLQVVPR